MRKVHVVPLVLSLLVAGCVPSLQPLYTEKDLDFDPALVGVWSGKNSKETWAFAQSATQEYRLVYTDADGKTGTFDVHLVSLDGRRYLDIFPRPPELEENDFYKFHFLRVHTFLRVREIDPNLRMAPLNPEWVDTYLAEHPDAVPHQKVNDRLVLTGSTKELQAFVAQLEEQEGAFGELSEMSKGEEAEKEGAPGEKD